MKDFVYLYFKTTNKPQDWNVTGFLVFVEKMFIVRMPGGPQKLKTYKPKFRRNAFITKVITKRIRMHIYNILIHRKKTVY